MKKGYDLWWVRNLDDLEEGLRVANPDVVILDIGLPGDPRFEALESVRTRTEAAIVVYSADMEGDQAVEAIKRGAQDFLLKGGFNAASLERAIVHSLERQRLLKKLDEARMKAEAASNAKSIFLGVMGHEFRTPMNGIIGGIHLLKHWPEGGGDSSEVVSLMERCAWTQVELIDDVIELARLESGDLGQDKNEFELKQLVTSVVDKFRDQALEKKLDLSVEIDQKVDGLMVSDRHLLGQALKVLVSNAVKFTNSGGVRVSARTAGEDVFEIEVEDTGIGISEDKLQSIFDPFTQADSSDTRKFQGVGLGLALLSRIVTVMGGRYHVVSRLNDGSKFSFSLPHERVESAIESVGVH